MWIPVFFFRLIIYLLCPLRCGELSLIGDFRVIPYDIYSRGWVFAGSKFGSMPWRIVIYLQDFRELLGGFVGFP